MLKEMKIRRDKIEEMEGRGEGAGRDEKEARNSRDTGRQSWQGERMA
jgi:hypothetical protein